MYIKARKVNFRWQRGIQVGAGNSGKVYTSINADTGDLMAMKEIRLLSNDYKTIKVCYFLI